MSEVSDFAAREEGGPPWIQPEVQDHMEWRDGDIVISVPVKSGTTWTMNIVHQLQQHEGKFEASSTSEVPILESGSMIRKGQVGQAKADGMTDDIAAHLRAIGSQICADPAMLDWFYGGGDVK